VAKRFYGKQSRNVALGIMSFTEISAVDGDDPMNAPILDEAGAVYAPQDKRISVLQHVARLKDGIPNPKERPMIPTGWNIKLQFVHQDNELVNIATLKRMVEQGGILGLGTFRPIFGRYVVSWS
jgi:hypothetical protein